MKLIAIRPLKRGGHIVPPGGEFHEFEVDRAMALIRNGLAQTAVYETKVVAPEVKPIAATPFRDLRYADHALEAEILGAVDSAMESADVPPQETDNRERRRRGRPRKSG